VNEHEHHDLRTSLGAYVLGQLPAAETAALEAHLDTCPSCTVELAELTPVAGALGQLRRHPAPGEPLVPPADLGDRVVEAVAGRARRERRRTWARAVSLTAAAAVVAVVASLTVQSLEGDDRGPDVPLETIQVRTERPGLEATAALVNHTWGVEVKLRAAGFDLGDRYRVSILGVDGRRYPAGEFVGTGRKDMDCNLNSSVLRDRASGLEVRDDAGRVVLTSAFS
jgi:hypothetical protein